MIGREHELRLLQRLLVDERTSLVTLTGTGGIGKTRLALEALLELADDFETPACVVWLAAENGPDRVLPAIATAAGLADSGRAPLLNRLQTYFAERRHLLLLDNFEHVSAAAPSLGELLSGCPYLTALVTSRSPLRIYGETVLQVPSMGLPDEGAQLGTDQPMESEAVQLFVERAQASRPDFELTDENSRAVVEICRRLDGVPLAIELAAARTKLLPPSHLLQRLDHPLTVLTGGPQDLPARQQAVRSTIDWSFALLTDSEREVLRRLSVFVGGFSLEAAESVCDATDNRANAPTIFEHVLSLADNGLLKSAELPGGNVRFSLRETVRDYASEKLVESGEAAQLHARHAAYFGQMARIAARHLRAPGQASWLDRLEAEHANLRAALMWISAAVSARIASAEDLVRLAVALSWFWYSRGHFEEGRAWLEAALAQVPDKRESDFASRAEVLFGLGTLLNRKGDLDASTPLLQESVALWRRTGDRRGLAYALAFFGIAALSGAPCMARPALEEAVALFRHVGDSWGLAYALNPAGRAAMRAGDRAAARSQFEEGMQMFRRLNDNWGLALSLGNLGDVALEESAPDARETLFAAVLASENGGDRWLLANALCLLGEAARRGGDEPEAMECYLRSVGLFHELGASEAGARSVLGLGWIALSHGKLDLACTLLGLVRALDAASFDFPFPMNRDESRHLEELLHAGMSEQDFVSSVAKGQGLSLLAASRSVR